MDSQLDAVRHRICKAEDEILETKQELAAAKQAGNKGGAEEAKFLRGQLLSLNNQLSGLNNQLSGLQEKENILLRSQIPSEPCLQLVHVGLPVLTPFALHSVPKKNQMCIKCQMRISTARPAQLWEYSP